MEIKSEEIHRIELNNVPFFISFHSPLTGERLGELKEVDGELVFEGKASESAKVFFDEVIKLNMNYDKRRIQMEESGNSRENSRAKSFS